STADPLTLVVWEAQFGDFANAGQVIIDNFISSSDTKWGLPNNLVMMLPHAQEGQGPEHSSARLERFLTLCADDNMIICNPTNSEQYFHLLRRQARQKSKKPLVILTPKSLLRMPEAKSVKDEFSYGKFNEIIDDNVTDKSKVKLLILTSGKVYYDLMKYRNDNKISDAVIVRVEQYYPYKSDMMKEILSSYKNANDVVWVQEEPENMGAWNFMALRLRKDISEWQKLYYVCRQESASPAAGSMSKHIETQNELIRRSFSKDSNDLL
ncbi:MAG: multifunctional oxoglutarate decarboxylase/oxoglutarate dehydrogenase thiamine pyrophosphate-binding subunit/dihydrolipoyllysine-residue succinyltransferase subunit, partial [Ignavibacteria bacterium]